MVAKVVHRVVHTGMVGLLFAATVAATVSVMVAWGPTFKRVMILWLAVALSCLVISVTTLVREGSE